MAVEVGTPGTLGNLPAMQRTDSSSVGNPLRFWAVLGVGWLSLFVYLMVKWLSGPYTKRVRSGPVPGWMNTVLTATVPVFLVATAFCVYWFVIRSYRRERRVTMESLLCLACLCVFWVLDPFFAYLGPTVLYNSHQWNAGSWAASIPGFQSIAAGKPGATMNYPLLWIIPAYVCVLFPITILCKHVMVKTKARFPTITVPRLMLVSIVFGTVADLVCELIFCRVGYFAYPSTISWLTIYAGHYYQFPIYEGVFTAFWWTAFASLLYFRNDKGETYIERGIDRVRGGPGVKVGIRFLALVGAGSCMYIITYTIPWSIASLQGGAWPKDLQKRSYLTNNLCGPGTNWACPSPFLPTPRRGAAHFDPQGRVIVPAGVPAPGK